MRTRSVSRPTSDSSPDSLLYGVRFSIVRFIVAIALMLITLGVVFAQGGRSFLSEAESGWRQESAANREC